MDNEEFARPLFNPGEAEQKEMFPVDVALRETFREQRSVATDVLGLSQAQLRQREQEHVTVVRDSDLNAYTTGKLLYELRTQADVADARGEEVDDAQIRAWNEESRRTLRQAYGEQDAEVMLARAAKFVRSKPRLAALLGRRGIGSRPAVVEAVVEHIRTVNYR